MRSVAGTKSGVASVVTRLTKSTKRAFAAHSSGLWCDLLFAPYGTSLLLHTHTFLQAVLGVLLCPTGSPATAHNVVLVAGIVANGLCTYALAFHYTRRSMPSLVAGVMFTWSTFVVVHLAATPRERVESELFGKDADTTGKLVEADGGTLFLDEIGDLPLDAQTRLLRVIDGSERAMNPKTGRRSDVRRAAVIADEQAEPRRA